MRYLFGFLCVCALGVMPLVGCSETSGTGGSGGDAGTGGDGGDGGEGGGGVGGFPCTEQGIIDAIAEGGGPHTFNCDGPQTVVTEGPILIDNDVALDGEGELTLDASRAETAVHVAQGVTAALKGFVVTNTGGEVGCEFECIAVLNAGTLALADVTVRGSQGNGWGIGNSGALTLTNSTVSENAVRGLENIGEATLTNCTVSENGEEGIENTGGTMTLTNCTLTGNGGAALSGGEDESVTVTGTIIHGDCIGLMLSAGYNIESPGGTCGFDQLTDLVNVTTEQLALGPLQDNGGPTETHALGAGSVAIDAIPEADCVDADDEPLVTDQREFTRPAGGGCDVGAFELQCIDNVCTCTDAGIRAAIMAGGSEPYTFDCDGPTTVAAFSYRYPIVTVSGDLILDGEGELTARSLQLDISEGSAVTLRRMNLSGTPGLHNAGGLTLDRVSLSHDNPRGSGPIVNAGGEVAILSSTIRQRIGSALITSCDGGTMLIENSTVTTGYPESLLTHGLLVSGTVTIVNSTLANYSIFSCQGDGAPLGVALNMQGSTLLGSCGQSGVTLVSNGHNIESTGDTCGFDQLTDQVDVTADALALGPLQDNGGPTMTHALLPGSVAIDAIPEVDCVNAEGEPLTTDQRGVARPQGPACDVGAFELEVAP